MGFLEKYRSLASTDTGSKLKLIQIGKPGAGKTTRALKATRWGNVMVFDFDDKLGTMKSQLSEADRPKVFFNSYKLTAGCETDAINAFLADLSDLEALAAEGKPLPFATLVLDTWTSWEMFYIPFLLDQNSQTKTSKGAQDVVRNTIDTGSGVINVPNLQDYGTIRTAQQKIVRRLTNLPCNIIMNFHEGTGEDQATKVKMNTLATIGSIRDTITASVDEVHRLSSTDGKTYKARIHQSIQWSMLRTKLPQTVGPELVNDDLSVFDDFAYKQ